MYVSWCGFYTTFCWGRMGRSCDDRIGIRSCFVHPRGQRLPCTVTEPPALSTGHSTLPEARVRMQVRHPDQEGVRGGSGSREPQMRFNHVDGLVEVVAAGLGRCKEESR